ncbi:MAG: hypothetical protein ACREHV_02265 [Rhizomicrobium sp.]
MKTIGNDVRFVYLRTEFGGVPGENDIPEGESRVVPMLSTRTRIPLRRRVYAFLSTFNMTAQLVRRRRVDAIVCVGCNHAAPMFLAGRLLASKTIFIESVTRVDRLSTTGKVIYYFRLASIFIVQWPDLQISYPSSRLGTIL